MSGNHHLSIVGQSFVGQSFVGQSIASLYIDDSKPKDTSHCKPPNLCFVFVARLLTLFLAICFSASSAIAQLPDSHSNQWAVNYLANFPTAISGSSSSNSVAANSTAANSSLVDPMPESAIPVEDLDSELVRNSIQRGVRFLLDERNGNNWRSSYTVGATGLAALALLSSGVSPESPEMVGVLNYLAVSEPNSTYNSSLIIMALAEADPVRYRPQIQDHANFLIQIQSNDGGFSYGAGNRGGSDSSNSQFAVLGLHAAQSAGIEIDKSIWVAAKAYWEGVFDRRNGGFGYNRGNSSYGSMTCAGICSLTIVEENLNEGTSRVRADNIKCCQEQNTNPMIEDGIRWLARNFSAQRNPSSVANGREAALFYYLYSLERTGRLTGRRFFGNHDWYREGANTLIKRQSLKGNWKGSAHSENDEVIATSMALLFLAKGLRPILLGKYKHNDNDWDPHPKGVQYLTRFVEKTWERKLNWQTIEADSANANDLLETPVLHITGTGRLNLTANQIEELKKYIDNGGFLFFESENGFDCPDARIFDQDVRNLLAILYPDAKLEVLKPEHMVWSAQFRLKPDQDFPLLGIQSCCRTSVIYCPAPISGVWQLDKPRSREYPKIPREKIDYAMQLGTNILAFATGNELKDKLERPKISGDEVDGTKNIGRRILIPKLRHQSGFDDAPMALSNLLRRVENDRGVQFQLKTEFVDADIEQLELHPIIFIHGRGKFSLSKEEKQALKEHLDRDGFIFGDAICGDQAFYDSFKQEMLDVASDAGTQWEKITASDDLYTEKFGGYPLGNVEIKVPKEGVTKTVKSAPQLEAIRAGDRYRIIFSRYDISCAMENGTSSSCYGYTVEDAARIGANILLYALQP